MHSKFNRLILINHGGMSKPLNNGVLARGCLEGLKLNQEPVLVWGSLYML